ncbi:MAG: hypothetical protein ABI203_02895 [Mucilaginibacter sp.]
MKVILFLVLLTAVACSNPVNNKDGRINLLADRTCRAITIRQQRFDLANKIRFAQDTLSKTKDENDSLRLKSELDNFAEQKGTLLKESLALADTIRLQLDSIMPYTDKAAQKRFTHSLDSLLAKKGCATALAGT